MTAGPHPHTDPHPHPHRRHSRLARIVGHAAAEIIRRIYAIGVIALTAYLSYRALHYLIVTLMFPAPTPGQITAIPTRLDASILRTRRSVWKGVTAEENPRGPLAHYHHLSSWIQPDPHNDCTRSGCHAPVPHARRKEVRAFLNMHATVLHCSVCHVQPPGGPGAPAAATWYDLESGDARNAPAVLQIYSWLLSDDGRRAIAQPTPQTQQRLTGLLATAVEESDRTPALQHFAHVAAAARYSSPEFRQMLASLEHSLPRNFRGEYGARIALVDPAARRPLLRHPNTERAVDDLLRESPAPDSPRRQQLVDAVHPLRRPTPLHCGECHRASGGVLNLDSLGYPPARVQALSREVVVRMIERIASGEPFYLPEFFPTVPGAQPVTTMPASR